MAHYSLLRDYRFANAVDDIRGAKLYGSLDEPIGTMDDIVFDHVSGDTRYVWWTSVTTRCLYPRVRCIEALRTTALKRTFARRKRWNCRYSMKQCWSRRSTGASTRRCTWTRGTNAHNNLKKNTKRATATSQWSIVRDRTISLRLVRPTCRENLKT